MGCTGETQERTLSILAYVWEIKGLVTWSKNSVGNTQNNPPWGNGRLRTGGNPGGALSTLQ